MLGCANPVRVWQERLIELCLLLCASLSVVITCAILWVLVQESSVFFSQVGIGNFLFDTQWSPLFDDPRFGVLPLLSATFVTSGIAVLLAIPTATIIAIYLSEFLGGRPRIIVKYILEIFGSIPTIVYGLFAFLYLTPFLQKFIPKLPGFNMLSAGLALGMMLIPHIVAIVDNAMQSVPMRLRESAYALGATRLGVVLIVYRSARPGVMTAYVLAISRAVGETMIVAMAGGMQPTLTLNPLRPGETATSYIVQVAIGDVAQGSIAYGSIFAVGLALMLMTLILNVIAYKVQKKGSCYLS